nr:MAG TPA: hypothetical protein [Caudoviricetes sp.]
MKKFLLFCYIQKIEYIPSAVLIENGNITFKTTLTSWIF